MYHQTPNNATDIELQSVDLGELSVSISHVDLLDEQALEFFHAHKNSIELYYVLEHSLSLQMINEELSPYTLNPQEFILFHPGVGHNVIYTPNQPKKYFLFNFSLSKMEQTSSTTSPQRKIETSLYADTIKAFRDRPYIHLRDDDGRIHTTIEDIISCANNQHQYWKAMRRALYMQLLVLLFNACKTAPSQDRSQEENIALQITQYFHANYQNPELNLAVLGKVFNLSTRQLTRIFEDHFSRTPMKILTFYRISYAKNYLLNTNWSIDDIAEAVGFSSASSLSRCFKEFENITVSEFRRKNKKDK